MTFIFDKGLESEKHIEIEFYSEQTQNKKLTSNKDFKIETQEDFPDISGFTGGMHFTDLEVKDGDMVVPITGTYNCIETFNTSYSSSSKFFQISMILGYKDIL